MRELVYFLILPQLPGVRGMNPLGTSQRIRHSASSRSLERRVSDVSSVELLVQTKKLPQLLFLF